MLTYTIMIINVEVTKQGTETPREFNSQILKKMQGAGIVKKCAKYAMRNATNLLSREKNARSSVSHVLRNRNDSAN